CNHIFRCIGLSARHHDFQYERDFFRRFGGCHSHRITRRKCATSYGGADTASTQYADSFDLRYEHIPFAPVYFPEPSSASTSGFTLVPSSSIERRNALWGICPTSICKNCRIWPRCLCNSM